MRLDTGKNRGRVIPRDLAEYVEDVARRHRGEVTRVLDRRISMVRLEDGAEAHAFPMVPVLFIGPFTDHFDTDAFLTGPYAGGLAGGASKSADGQLRIEAIQGSTIIHSWAECGRVGGAFLPNDADFTIETAITALDDSNVASRGSIGVDDRSAGSGSTEWYVAAGTAVTGYYLKGPTKQIFWKANAAISYTNVDFTPSASQPVYLRIEYDHGSTTVTFKYKGGGASSWTTAGSYDVGADYWSDKMDVFTIIDSPGNGGTGVFSADFDYLAVDYAPEEATDEYAFIPTEGFAGHKKNYIYVRKTNSTYLEIEPQEWMAVCALGRLWRYDGGDWVTLDTTHNALTGVGEDDHHDRRHPIDGTDDHEGVSGAAEDNFAAFDENSLPKDSGKSASSFANASHEHGADDITSGTLSTDRFSAYSDLTAESKIGTGAGQVAAGDHTHDDRYYTETEVDNLLDNKADLAGSDDIEITDSSKGLILKSPNSHRWRVTVDDSGNLSTTDLGT